jgi:hypothetical protein
MLADGFLEGVMRVALITETANDRQGLRKWIYNYC